jgi:hypothetical protein
MGTFKARAYPGCAFLSLCAWNPDRRGLRAGLNDRVSAGFWRPPAGPGFREPGRRCSTGASRPGGFNPMTWGGASRRDRRKTAALHGFLQWPPFGRVFPNGLRPSRAEGCAGQGPPPTGGIIPGLPRFACADAPAAALRAGEPPPRSSPYPLLPPVSPTGRVVAAAANPSPRRRP